MTTEDIAYPHSWNATILCRIYFQGTIATEFLSQVPDLDTILVPISGGGMTSGIAIATKNIRPECKSTQNSRSLSVCYFKLNFRH